jgi:hypothetical protein
LPLARAPSPCTPAAAAAAAAFLASASLMARRRPNTARV